jgi:hypothetical protein
MRRFNMLSRAYIRAALTAGALAFALPFIGGSASAEDGSVYGIRDQCIDQVGGGYAGIYGNAESNYGQRRTNVYSSCMRSHGLRP